METRGSRITQHAGVSNFLSSLGGYSVASVHVYGCLWTFQSHKNAGPFWVPVFDNGVNLKFRLPKIFWWKNVIVNCVFYAAGRNYMHRRSSRFRRRSLDDSLCNCGRVNTSDSDELRNQNNTNQLDAKKDLIKMTLSSSLNMFLNIPGISRPKGCLPTEISSNYY